MDIKNIKSNWVVFGLLTILVLATFGNALFNGFVYDDHYLIQDNTIIRSFSNLGHVLTSDVAVATPIGKPSGYYRPMSMLFLMLLYKIWGLNTFGLHLTSLLIHLANSFLVFLIVSRITSHRMLGFVTSLLFAVHPVHVEAVTPIFNYMGILATLFSLLSFWFFLEDARNPSRKYFLASVLLYFLAVFSKEEAIVLPAVFVLYDLYWVCQLNWKSFARRLLPLAWFLVPAACYIAARLVVMQKAAALGFWHLNIWFNVAAGHGAIAQSVIVVKTFFHYFWILLFPFRLSAYYLLPDPMALSRTEIFTSVLLVVGLLAFAVAGAKRHRVASFFIFFFFITSFMISNIIPIGGLFAERFMYLPSLSFCLFVAYLFVVGVERLSARNAQKGQLAFMVGLLVILGLYGQASAARNYVWRNDVILWSDAAQKTPQSYRPFLYLADAYSYHGDIYAPKALAAYQESLKRPGAPELQIRYSLGRVYATLGQYDLALIEFDKALQVGGPTAIAYYNLGITHYYQKDYSKALSYFHQGLTMDKSYFWLYYGIGLVYGQEGKKSEARAMFEKALQIQPRFKMAQDALERM